MWAWTGIKKLMIWRRRSSRSTCRAWTCSLVDMFFKGESRKVAEVKRSQLWQDTGGLRQAKKLCGGGGALTAVRPRFAGPSARRVSCDGQNFLRDFVSIRDTSTIWDCRFYGAEEENPRHLLMNCIMMLVARARSFGRHQLSLEDSPGLDSLQNLDLLKRIGLDD